MQSEELPGIVDTERLESFNPSPGLCQHPTQGSTRSFPSNIPIDHVSQVNSLTGVYLLNHLHGLMWRLLCAGACVSESVSTLSGGHVR